ncbi:hypothetical protein QYE76_061301 [Lolium multiflorum]|uniref:Reverse transcriptase/retrotransposon-derived protein RNase H-like domain-containing protein n=1 Tax=Lolium multiflorum TaxID=4521 RepID=A0AAD8S1V6_LOLMU|nr:hypothetical protein QYE76_061301 [Lolium multiflorum]
MSPSSSTSFERIDFTSSARSARLRRPRWPISVTSSPPTGWRWMRTRWRRSPPGRRPFTTRSTRFPGLAGYYRKFIQEFGLIAAPLTRLLRRDAFAWDDEATAAFEALKGALTTGPVLQMPDFDMPLSSTATHPGGVRRHPSPGRRAARLLQPALAARHLKLAAYEQELIGLVQAVRHWWPYLWGRSFRVLPSWRLNTVADALSRRDTDPRRGAPRTDALCIRSGPSFALFDRLAATASRGRQRCGSRRRELDEPRSFVDGLLLHDRRVFVPDHEDLRHQAALGTFRGS